MIRTSRTERPDCVGDLCRWTIRKPAAIERPIGIHSRTRSHSVGKCRTEIRSARHYPEVSIHSNSILSNSLIRTKCSYITTAGSGDFRRLSIVRLESLTEQCMARGPKWFCLEAVLCVRLVARRCVGDGIWSEDCRQSGRIVWLPFT